MNHVSVEEIEDQPDAVVSKFLINAFTALALFNTVALKSPMLVSSPGAEYMASRGCYQLPVTIGRHVFPTNLIVLESQGLDVILGMD